MENLGFLDLIKTSLFWSRKYSFLSTISKNDLFWLICPKNTHEKIFEFVTKTWTNRFGTFGFFGVFSETLLSLCEKHSFYLEHQKPNFSCLICPKNTQEKIFDFFYKNHALNFDFSDFFKISLFWFKKHSFLSRISKDEFF